MRGKPSPSGQARTQADPFPPTPSAPAASRQRSPRAAPPRAWARPRWQPLPRRRRGGGGDCLRAQSRRGPGCRPLSGRPLQQGSLFGSRGNARWVCEAVIGPMAGGGRGAAHWERPGRRERRAGWSGLFPRSLARWMPSGRLHRCGGPGEREREGTGPAVKVGGHGPAPEGLPAEQERLDLLHHPLVVGLQLCQAVAHVADGVNVNVGPGKAVVGHEVAAQPGALVVVLQRAHDPANLRFELLLSPEELAPRRGLRHSASCGANGIRFRCTVAVRPCTA